MLARKSSICVLLELSLLMRMEQVTQLEWFTER
jgi:hypothetical protein